MVEIPAVAYKMAVGVSLAACAVFLGFALVGWRKVEKHKASLSDISLRGVGLAMILSGALVILERYAVPIVPGQYHLFYGLAAPPIGVIFVVMTLFKQLKWEEEMNKYA